MKWMIEPYLRYADFTGRSRRLEYWMFTLFFYGCLVLLAIIAFSLDGFTPTQDDGEMGPLGMTFVILAGLFILASIVPKIAVTVRRFHDQDKSGWMYLLSFIPYIGGLVIFVFMLVEGTNGENSYGPDPKRPELNTDVFS